MKYQILIAPNAFKHSVDAKEIAAALLEGFRKSALQFDVQLFPIADGGDGTASLLTEHCKGQLIYQHVQDPLGRTILSSIGLIDEGRTAVIELANASGLRLLNVVELRPLLATTFGTGQLMLRALEESVSKIILCVGGSATVDGGTGILSALGARLLDSHGEQLNGSPASLIYLDSVDTSQLDKRLPSCKVDVLCDVDIPLLGPSGAAPVFGPQKGASALNVVSLEQGLMKWRDVVLQHTGVDMAGVIYGGAAGGVAAGLAALLDAYLVNGIEYFLSTTNFDDALKKANIVITGEGSMDRQTLKGKGPLGVAKRAKLYGIPVVGIAGVVDPQATNELAKYFDLLLSVNKRPKTLAENVQHTRENLINAAESLGNDLAAGRIKLN